jgi:adenosylcobinamide-GDP ribazoletransferase
MSIQPHKDIAAAFMLLTRIPVPWNRISKQAPDLGASLWAYPLVGGGVGGLGALIFVACQMLSLSDPIAVIIALCGAIFATGAFHEDGLADVADGLGGGIDRTCKLDIMRDSRIGTYGGLALLLAIFLKIAGLTSISVDMIPSAFIVAAIVSRLMIVFTLKIFSPARKDGLSTQTGKPTLARIGIACLLSGLSLLILTGVQVGAFVFLSAFLAMAIMGLIANRQVGGFTGDALGAVQQLSELAIILTLSVVWAG